MVDINLEKVHNIQLEMATEVKRLCEEHNIRYFLIAGTLLGAIRHNGFIPWDDDMDIGMLREDYERFIEVCKVDLKFDYYLQTWHTDPQFGLPIAKIRKNGTKFVEKASANNQIHSGIYIDIFPYDNIPDSNFLRKKHKWLTYLYKRSILIKNNYDLEINKTTIEKFFIKTLKLTVKLFPKAYIIKKYTNQMKKYNKCANTEKITIFGGAYSYEKEAIRREWITNVVMVEFENIQFCIPKEAKLMLNSIYGDYLKLPPEDKRYNRHGIVEINYGGYDE